MNFKERLSALSQQQAVAAAGVVGGGLGGGGGGSSSSDMVDLTAKFMSGTALSPSPMRDMMNSSGGGGLGGGPMYPPKSQIKRQKMIYHCKFGEFGILEGQFTEPSGVAVNAQNDIIVADTNNHR